MQSRTASGWVAAMWQVPVILLLAAVMAVAVNRLRPDDRLPLMAGHPPTASVQVRDEGDRISLQQARELFGQDGALFLDARSRDDYLRGHIRDALSLPWQEADDHFAEVADRLTGIKSSSLTATVNTGASLQHFPGDGLLIAGDNESSSLLVWLQQGGSLKKDICCGSLLFAYSEGKGVVPCLVNVVCRS